MIKNAVIYARYSCDKQTEQSIEGQLRVCKEYAKENNLNIVKIYQDEAKTGTNDNRPNFQQMLRDSLKGTFQIVLVYSLDRFGRNRIEVAVNKYSLKKNNIVVISATQKTSENIDGTKNLDGILLESVYEGLAEYYSAELSQKTKRGMKESIIKGNFTGGHILYGYKVIDKKVYINEEEAEAVKFIFNEYANGTTKTEIVKQLNKKGFTINGKPFKINNLQDKLKNKKYIGINEYEGKEYNNMFPAIIEKSTFDKVQTMLNRNKKNSGHNKAKTNYILSGKLFCGLCGHSMVGTSGKSGESKHTYYTCSNRYKNHKCNKIYEKKQELEDFVFEKTMQYILKPHIVDKIVNNVYEYAKTNENAQIKEIEQKLNKIDLKIQQIYSVFQKTSSQEIIDMANKDIERLSKEKEDLKQQYANVQMTTPILKTKPQIREVFNTILETNYNEDKYRERIIKTFINSIFVFEDKIVIYYNMFDNHTKTHEEMLEDLKENSSTEGIEKFNRNDILNSVGSHNTTQVVFFLWRAS